MLAVPDKKKSRRTYAVRGRVLALGQLDRAEAFDAFCERIKSEAQGLAGASKRDALLRSMEKPDVTRTAFNSWTERHAASTWIRPDDIWFEATATWSVLGAFAKGWFDKAEVDAQAGKLTHAIWAYERALELWPEFSEAAARMKVMDTQRDAGGWAVMRHSSYAREDSVVGEYATKAAAAARVAELSGTTDDHHWMVPLA